MISVRFLVARSVGRASAGERRAAAAAPLRTRHLAAMTLLFLLAVAIAGGLFLVSAVVGLVLAVPVLAMVFVSVLWRRREGGVVTTRLDAPFATTNKPREARGLLGAKRH